MTFKERYNAAHFEYYKVKYPQVVADGFYCSPTLPKYKTANGLTKFITNYILWAGWRATRVNTTGRLVDGIEKTASGLHLSVKKWIPGTTRKGTADISATIKGRSVMIEIKIGKDKASEYQLTEQALERKSGGIYEFISTPDEFFVLYDYVLGL
jgi:hypothetical protein